MAKNFFYISAGIMALLIAFAAGAIRAVAQTSASVTAARCTLYAGTPHWACVVGRTVHYAVGAGGLNLRQQVAQEVPGTEPIMDVGALTGNYIEVILANGDVYECFPAPTSGWNYLGNLAAGSPVGAERATWGAVKTRYK